MGPAVNNPLSILFENNCKQGDCHSSANTTRVEVIELTDFVTEEDCGVHILQFDIIDIFRYCVKAFCDGNNNTIIDANLTINANRAGETDFPNQLIENEPNLADVLSNPVVISSIYESFEFIMTTPK